jgi:hypothetical protein
MNTSVRFAAISFALALGVSGVSIAGYAMPQHMANAPAEQAAIDDIIQARTALSHGRPIAALTDTENAETVLLNAEQAGSIQDPEATLAALSWADSDLQLGWSAAAASELDTAITDLG